MSIDRRLPVVLNWLQDDLAQSGKEVQELEKMAHETSGKLDLVETRLQNIASHLGIGTCDSTPTNRPSGLQSSPRTRPVRRQDWEELCRLAEANLIGRGVGVDQTTLDHLLDPVEVDDIQRRFEGNLSIKTELDCYDIAVSVTAGLVAALVDLLIVRIPKNLTYLRNYSQKGSPITTALQSIKVPADNWLGKYFKVAYDRVKDVPVDGFSVRSHRLQSIGHDPLVGLAVGTVDIMRGGLTAIGKSGTLHFLSDTGQAIPNPITAFVFQLGHLLSDGFTPMGLPPPGWSALQLLQVGDFGTRHRTAADLARFMYLKGYDSRHFLTMTTSVAAAETVLRGYFALRQKLDPRYRTQTGQEAELIGTERTGRHPRFLAMALAAHGIAAAANVGKVVCHHGNPLAINYAQWLRFFQAFFSWASQHRASSSEALIMRATVNLKEIQEGWPDIDVDDPEFPRVVPSEDPQQQ